MMCNGVIIDLRGNPGGLLPGGHRCVQRIFERRNQVVVSTHPDRETRNGPTQAVADDDHGNEVHQAAGGAGESILRQRK